MTHPDHVWAYAAGWFEGRGYARVGCQKGRTPRLTVYIRMPPHRADWFKTAFPGSTVFSVKSEITWPGGLGSPTTKTEGGYNWAIARIPAQQFLQGILPYLQYRKDFVTYCIEFIERVVVNGERFNDDLAALVQKIRETGRLGQ